MTKKQVLMRPLVQLLEILCRRSFLYPIGLLRVSPFGWNQIGHHTSADSTTAHTTLYYEKALANKLPTIDEANFPYHQFPTDSWYVYGALFVEYLADTYGDDKLTSFIDEISGRNKLTAVQSAFVSVYGKSTYELYNEWVVHTYKHTHAHLKHTHN